MIPENNKYTLLRLNQGSSQRKEMANVCLQIMSITNIQKAFVVYLAEQQNRKRIVQISVSMQLGMALLSEEAAENVPFPEKWKYNVRIRMHHDYKLQKVILQQLGEAPPTAFLVWIKPESEIKDALPLGQGIYWANFYRCPIMIDEKLLERYMMTADKKKEFLKTRSKKCKSGVYFIHSRS